jgi:hypothetical protein
MGYLIEQGFIKHETFYIEESIVQAMDSTNPYQLKKISGSYYIPIAANVTLDNNGYSGWNHLHLSMNDILFAVPSIIATLAINSTVGNTMGRNFNYQFCMNFQTSPNRFGSNIFKDNDLYIWWDTLPTSGSGNMYLDIYYVNQTFR